MIKNQGLKNRKKDDNLSGMESLNPKKQDSPKKRQSPDNTGKSGKRRLSFALHMGPQCDEGNHTEDYVSEIEFINAVKGIKNLYRKLFPRTLIFREVLLTEKKEEEFDINKLLLQNGRPKR